MTVEEIKKIVKKVADESGSSNVFDISKQNGVLIQYGRWYPVTIGEYERKTKTITVNLNAMKDSDSENLEETIIAHELGHFFAQEFNFDKNEEEHFAHQFAQTLISFDEI